MRRRLIPILAACALPAAALFAEPDEPKTLPDAAPAKPKASRKPPARGDSPALKEALKKVEKLLREREARLIEQVRKIVDEELRRAAAARRKEEEQREAKRKAQAKRVRDRLDGIAKQLETLRDRLDGALAEARKALGDTPAETDPAEGGEETVEAPPRRPVPEPYRKLIQAIRLHQSGEYEEAIKGFDEAIAGLEKMKTAEARRYRAEALYYAACSHAILGRAEPAFDILEQAIRAGYRNMEKIENDAELDPLREDPRFERIHRYARSLRG
jgi:tetratricopeptide (TPR) repeat protein